MFRGLFLYCSVLLFVLFRYYWCIRNPSSSSSMLYNNNIIAHNHHAHNGINVFLYFYISTSTILTGTVKALTSAGVPSCEVFFAKQGPNSGIVPHSDKNNFIITCHLGLDVPPASEGECFIKVGNKKKYWLNGEACIFDTSIHHSTENQTKRTRYVLLIRFWHPDLTQLEIKMFKYIFQYVIVLSCLVRGLMYSYLEDYYSVLLLH